MQEQIYLMRSSSGAMVRVPESKLEAWERAQQEVQRNPKLTPEEEQKKQEILRMFSK